MVPVAEYRKAFSSLATVTSQEAEQLPGGGNNLQCRRFQRKQEVRKLRKYGLVFPLT